MPRPAGTQLFRLQSSHTRQRGMVRGFAGHDDGASRGQGLIPALRSMKILYLNSSGGLGGAEVCLLDMIASLKQEHPEWTLGLIAAQDGPLVARDRKSTRLNSSHSQ